MLSNVAGQTGHEACEYARATLDQMFDLRCTRTRNSFEGDAQAAVAAPLKRRRNVYTANNTLQLPGKLVMSEHKPRSADVHVAEAYDGSGATYDFYAEIFGRNSIDGRGMRIDSSVHYGSRFDNAMWNGRQMVYGDGDGVLFNRFTVALDVIAHELTHGVTQYTAALSYEGETGALNEHLSDAFGIMVKQYKLGQTVKESDWLIGAGLFAPHVHGKAIRSMAEPGSAYDDPVLGRDPQPAHMRDFVETDEDNGGVHINSGILNHAFYLIAMRLGGRSWEVPGRIWYHTMTERLMPDAGFDDFARAAVDIAGEMYGNGGNVQKIVADGFARVGLHAPVFDAPRTPRKRDLIPPHDAAAPLPKWRDRPAR
jgi:Zn-dependent metalloprotease